MASITHHWIKRLTDSNKPAYLLIADLIEEDIASQRLRAKDKLPGLRELAEELQLNYTTIARAYKEASQRGLIETQVGSGTFVRGRPANIPLRDGSGIQMSMNMPPEPPELAAQLSESMAKILADADIYDLLRYDDAGGSPQDREVAASWLRAFVPEHEADRILIGPGIHGILLALMSQLARPGELICVESLVYPGIKAIAAQLGIRLAPIACDADGPIASAFENACKTLQPKAFYCNPTLQNPSTNTIPLYRRRELVDIAQRYNTPIIEDDAYGMLPVDSPVTLTALAPDLCWYISGFAKCFGAGLRIGFVAAPSVRQAQRLAGALRATTVMTCPITSLLAISWIKSGIAAEMLKAIRNESSARQGIAEKILNHWDYQVRHDAFHLWLPVPAMTGWRASELALHLRTQGVGIVASVAFSADNTPEEAVRICLGGPQGREELRKSLKLVAETLEFPHHFHFPMM